MNQTRRKRHLDQARKTAVDLKEMREDARRLLGWEKLTPEDAAEFASTNPRTWLRWENTPKAIPATVVKLFWFEVCLTALEQAEDSKKPEALEKALGKPLTINNVYDWVYERWESWDPDFLAHKKISEEEG